MRNQLREHVNNLFARYSTSHETRELKDELLSNVTERYDDLVRGGMNPNEAYAKVVSSIGDIDELVRRSARPYDREAELQRLRNSAKWTVWGLAFFFIGVIALIVMDAVSAHGVWGLTLMLVCFAIGVCLLVYNSIVNPRTDRDEPKTVVNDFRQWTSGQQKRKQLRTAFNAMLWTGTTALYFIISFVTYAWHITWVIFIIAAFVQIAVRMLFILTERDVS